MMRQTSAPAEVCLYFVWTGEIAKTIVSEE
jgi:hypothetical protein